MQKGGLSDHDSRLKRLMHFFFSPEKTDAAAASVNQFAVHAHASAVRAARVKALRTLVAIVKRRTILQCKHIGVDDMP